MSGGLNSRQGKEIAQTMEGFEPASSEKKSRCLTNEHKTSKALVLKSKLIKRIMLQNHQFGDFKLYFWSPAPNLLKMVAAFAVVVAAVAAIGAVVMVVVVAAAARLLRMMR